MASSYSLRAGTWVVRLGIMPRDDTFNGTARELLLARERCLSSKLVQGLVSKTKAKIALF